MNENPPPQDQIEAVLPQYKYLGIELGKLWKRESVKPQTLQVMKLAAEFMSPMMEALLPLASAPVNGWTVPPASIGMPGADYPLRAMVAVVGLTANTLSEAVYYLSVTDGDGKPLTGEKRYRLTLNDSMQCIQTIAPGFWSVTAYDKATGFTIPNAINRYALGSDDELKRNADDSFTLDVQHDNPGPDREANWLPISEGPFYLLIRAYAPAPEVVAGLANLATFQAPPPLIPTSHGA